MTITLAPTIPALLPLAVPTRISLLRVTMAIRAQWTLAIKRLDAQALPWIAALEMVALLVPAWVAVVLTPPSLTVPSVTIPLKLIARHSSRPTSAFLLCAVPLTAAVFLTPP